MKPVVVDGVTYYPIKAIVRGRCEGCAGIVKDTSDVLCGKLRTPAFCSGVIFQDGVLALSEWTAQRLTE